MNSNVYFACQITYGSILMITKHLCRVQIHFAILTAEKLDFAPALGVKRLS